MSTEPRSRLVGALAPFNGHFWGPQDQSLYTFNILWICKATRSGLRGARVHGFFGCRLMGLAQSARSQVPLILAALFSAPASSFQIPGSSLSHRPSCSSQAGRGVDRQQRMSVSSADGAAAALSFCRSSPDAVIVTVRGPAASPFFTNIVPHSRDSAADHASAERRTCQVWPTARLKAQAAREWVEASGGQVVARPPKRSLFTFLKIMYLVSVGGS